MLKLRHTIVVWALICGFPAAADDAPPLFQYSTLNALLHGLYDGDLSIGALSRRGDFGLGTLNRVDGELVAADGVFYQVRTDGRAYVVPAEAETPFAAVTHFAADRTAPILSGQDLAAFERHLDGLLTSPNHFAAIRVEGLFPRLVVRSVPAQSRPYRPLAEVVGEQVKFELEDVAGTLVGIRAPAFMAGLTVPGYHFHFLTADRGRGGHVLAMTTGSGTIAIDEIAVFELQLPATAEFSTTDLSGSRQDEVDRVEKSAD